MNKFKAITSYAFCTVLGVVIFLKMFLIAIITTTLMIPYLISLVFIGLNKSNLYMSKILRKPNNWLDEGYGDFLVYCYEKILDGSF